VSLVHTNEGLILAYLLADCDQLFVIDPLVDGARDIEFTSEGVQRTRTDRWAITLSHFYVFIFFSEKKRIRLPVAFQVKINQ
jgi:hypothetical protein